MLNLIRKIKIIGWGLSGACFTWVVLAGIRFIPLANDGMELVDLFFYERFFIIPFVPHSFLESQRDAHRKLVIIDSKNQAQDRRRSEYAELIEQLHKAGAACIGLDIRFLKRSNADTSDDLALVEAVKSCSLVVLPIKFVPEIEENNEYKLAKSHLESELALNQRTAGFFLFQIPARFIELPFTDLLRAVRHVGHINFNTSQYHLFPLVMKCGARSYPAFPFQMAQIYSQSQGKRLDITSVPTTGYARILINFLPLQFLSDPFTFEEARVFFRQNPEEFKNKIVLFVNSLGEESLPGTPLLGKQDYPRWAIITSIVCQLLDDKNIVYSRATALLLALSLLFLSFIWLLFVAERFAERWRKMLFVILAGNGVLIVTIFFFLLGRIWLGLITPAIVFTTGMLLARKKLQNVYQLLEYDDFSITVGEPIRGRYPVSLTHSPAGEDNEKISFGKFFAEAAFTEQLTRLDQLTAKANDLLEIGKKLYDAIFQKSIATRLEQSLTIIKSKKKFLRIRLRLDAPEVSRLPWEYFHNKNLPIGFLAQHTDVSLTRYLPGPASSEPPAFRGPLSVLLVISSPNDLRSLGAFDEKKIIKKSFGILPRLRQIKLHVCEHATLEGVAAEIKNGNYHVLHYIGHGEFHDKRKKGSLVMLEKEDGDADPVDAEAFAINFQNSSIRLVVLNSCQGAIGSRSNTFLGAAQALVKVGIPAVVAMQHKIYDDIAILFSRVFYTSFLTHFSIDYAVADVRQAIRNKTNRDRQDWGTPVLFMREDGKKIFSFK